MLDKAIASGKEWRKGYRKSKRFDSTCRNHGSCPHCKSDRLHFHNKAELAAADERKEIVAQFAV